MIICILIGFLNRKKGIINDKIATLLAVKIVPKIKIEMKSKLYLPNLALYLFKTIARADENIIPDA